MYRAFILALILLPVPAQSQPVSWGMAQCSALMEVMEGYVNRQPQKTYLADAAQAMLAAAQVQSQVEGRDPGELGQVQSAKRQEWVDMGYSMAFKAEFRDWTDYCKSLARSYDIPLHKSML